MMPPCYHFLEYWTLSCKPLFLFATLLSYLLVSIALCLLVSYIVLYLYFNCLPCLFAMLLSYL
ncbi:hypothetical protein EDB19DRAFT_1725554 [Suillus lakei]|nr:hypothetical protein EDB19DRAFT_1725554 [Suillus lakei]